mgnify:CR=1 FL=1
MCGTQYLIVWITEQMRNRKDEGIMENEQKEVFVCWIDEDKKILSFHFVEGFERKEFETKTEFHEFMMHSVSRGLRVQ